MAAWTIGVEITESGIEGEGLARLVDVLEREFPDFGIECALWSGWLGVRAAVVTAPTPAEALEAVLNAIELGFDEADIDVNGASEIVNVTMRRTRRLTAVPAGEPLPRALLRRVRPSRR